MKPGAAGVVVLGLCALIFAICGARGRSEAETSGAPVVGAAVAASVQHAFDDMAQAFTRRTGIAVKTSYGSSGKLATQIRSGAPFDIFFAADMDYPASLRTTGHAPADPRVYALGTLAVWTMKEIDLVSWPRLLASPAVRKVAIANPRTAPFGREALRALERAGVSAAVQRKLVFGESVAQANEMVFSGAAEIGLTAAASLRAPGLQGARAVELDPAAYGSIPQAVIVLRGSSPARAEAARRLCEFVLGPEGRGILARYGYRFP